LTFAYPGDFERTAYSSSFYAQIMNFGTEFTTRAAKYQNCWDFYKGEHWSQQSPEGFDQITVNYCKAFVTKLRRFAFRSPWTTAFTEEQKADGIDTWVNSVWEENNVKLITNTVADFGGIFGDWYIYPQWLPSTDEDILEEREANPFDLKIVALDPRFVFPQYNAKTGEMEVCIIMIPYQDFTLVGNSIEVEDKIYKEIHTKDRIFIEETNSKNEVIESRALDNPLHKMLIVHGICQPQAGSYFGNGIVEDIMKGNQLFNEKTSNISDILDYHAAPITIIYGAKAKQLERGANKIWAGLPTSAKVENLSSEGNIEEARDFLKDIKSWMHELSGVPEKSLGGERNISNTSATALSIDFEPLIELADDVRFYFDEAIKKVNELIIDIGIYNKFITTNLKPPDIYKQKIDHGALLPRDRSLDLADIAAEINLGIESKKGAMERLGVRNIDTKLKEIEQEREDDADFEARLEQLKQKYTEPQNNIPDAFMKNIPQTPEQEKARKAVNKNTVVHGEQVVNEQIMKKS